MIANRPPFRALNEYLTFQKVTSGTISYPNNFPEIAKVHSQCYTSLGTLRLTLRFLLQDLISKLVVKDVFSRLGANDFADLKAHPFFKDIDWFGLGKGQAPPIEKYPEPLVWQEDIIREEEERKRRKKEEERKEWEQFLLENEQILESGLIYKRRKLSIKKRFMILTDTPRIIYIDPKKKILKGEVPWSKKLFVEVRNDIVWRINTVRTFSIFCCML
jgi:3-phosphoinositide dependent protein kinase-1